MILISEDILFDTYKFGNYTNRKQSLWSNIGITLTVCLPVRLTVCMFMSGPDHNSLIPYWM